MVQINDMYYVWASEAELLQKGECGGAVTSLLQFMLKNGIVDGVLGIRQGRDIFDPIPVLVENADDIIQLAGSMHAGTQNVVKIVEKYLSDAPDYKFAITTKPCECMTLIELIKRGQIKRENIVILGLNCGGTLPPIPTHDSIAQIFKIDPETVDSMEIGAGNLIIKTKSNEIKKIGIDKLEEEKLGRRSNCRRCDVNIPLNSDLGFGNWGVSPEYSGKATFVEVLSAKGSEILKKAFAGKVWDYSKPDPYEVKKRDKIDHSMIKLAQKWQQKDFLKEGGLLELIHSYQEQFKKCIKCFGCREACPICYCDECTLEMKIPRWIESGQIPPSPIFHLERLLHKGESCVNCGQCEDVCPVEIPLSSISHEISSQIKDIFQYYPGMDYNKPPISIFSPKHP